LSNGSLILRYSYILPRLPTHPGSATACAHCPKLAHALARAAAGRSSSMRSRRSFSVHLLMHSGQIWPMPSSSVSSQSLPLLRQAHRRGGGWAAHAESAGREMSGLGRETSRWGSLCLPVVGKHRFWVCNSFTVQHLNLGMGHHFAFSLLESV
jgi:hypothetical protein